MSEGRLEALYFIPRQPAGVTGLEMRSFQVDNTSPSRGQLLYELLFVLAVFTIVTITPVDFPYMSSLWLLSGWSTPLD